METQIHSTALVDPRASLGIGVQVGAYAIIEADVCIGDRTKVDAMAQVKSFTTLGVDNHVHAYACIGGPPQDLKYQNQETSLEVGDRNCIREYVTLNRGTEDGGAVTRVGSDCMLMAYAHVAHDCQLGDEVILANAATLAGHVQVGEKSVIGGLSAVHQFVRIGEYVFIGGKTGVPQDVPPYMLTVGERAQLYGLNKIGLRRRGFSKEAISDLKKSYQIIWRSGLSRRDSLEQVSATLGHYPEVKNLVEFIRNSKRGIASSVKEETLTGQNKNAKDLT